VVAGTPDRAALLAFPEFLTQMLDAGSLYPYLKQKINKGEL
jgi:hypothetical protein